MLYPPPFHYKIESENKGNSFASKLSYVNDLEICSYIQYLARFLFSMAQTQYS